MRSLPSVGREEDPGLEKSSTCDAFRRQVVHFQADELPGDQRRSLQEHLDACPDCARRLEVEEVFLTGLKQRLQRVPLPPGFETRIRGRLRSEGGAASASATAWFRRPWVAVAAASVLLAVLLVPGVFDADRGQSLGAIAVDREVVLVDGDCERAGRTFSEQRRCNHPRHLNVLKVADGTYWNISQDEEEFRSMLFSIEQRGHTFRIRGQFYPHIKTLKVSQAQDLDLNTL